MNASTKAASKPKIIFILADDMSYRDLSVFGQTKYQTPHLDALAVNGMRFTDAYAGAPECAPSRGTLLTSLHTGHANIRKNSSARGQDYLPDKDITIAEVLKKAGYATCMAGKWGCGLPETPGVPYKQGFDYSCGFYDQKRAHTFYPEYLYFNEKKVEYPGNFDFDMERQYRQNKSERPDPDDANVYDENGKLTPQEINEPDNMVYSQDEMEKFAIDFIKDHKSQPFFLYFATQLPHGPTIIDNLGELKDRDDYPLLKQKEWAAMVKRVDTFTGELVGLLKKLGLYDNTIIFFASDNGYSMCGYMGRGNQNKNWPDDPFLQNKGPFTGGKFSALEGGLRVPFFVHWADRIKPAISNEPVWLLDIFPTAAELAKVTIDFKIDGKSLLPLLTKGEWKGHEFLYWENRHEQAVRLGPWKAYRQHPDKPLKLYLVNEDTFGERDLAALYPDVIKRVEHIMETEHIDHPWYQNPGESKEAFEAKKTKAKELGQLQNDKFANSIKEPPW